MDTQVSYLARFLAQDYPELASQLSQTGNLPANERVQLAVVLRTRLAACAAFMPARLVQDQLRQPRPGQISGAFWNGSLLFADLSGFTALSEQLSSLGRQGSEEVTAIVSHLFDVLIAEIHARQGSLLKFGGDALTAFFDAASLGEQHVAAAAAAALAMQRRMDAFADLATRVGTFALRLRVGVHSGRVFAASVGDQSHVELVVTGPVVNRVAMAQELAVPGQVVISSEAIEHIPGVTVQGVGRGFHRLTDLPEPVLPPPHTDLFAHSGLDDLQTLERLAHQLAALEPYLVRGLPRRFLEVSEVGLGEFRPVTVLFINIHDFSAILAHLQHAPDLAAAVFNAYYRRAQTVVHRYDGIVNKVDMYTHGDKLMVLFGAPVAHEDASVRAIRCALDLATTLDEANAEVAALLAPVLPMPFQFVHKMGINTGTVFAGRVGGSTRYEYTVMGSNVNLAARLMSAAADHEVLISPATRLIVAGQFDLVDSSPLQLKGIRAPVIPSRVVRVADVAIPLRGGASEQRTGPTPLIGRDHELATLFDLASDALLGHGRMLALVGDAGAGKTRLAEELLQRLVIASMAPDGRAMPSFSIYLGECQSYDQRTPYAAVRGPLRTLLSLSVRYLHEPELTARLAIRVRQLAPELERFTPLLGDALGVALEESPLTTSLSPEQRHDRLQELIVALFAGATMQDRMLILIEDVHWADLPSHELLSQLALAAVDLPLLLLVTYRPDTPITALWIEKPTTVKIPLGELTSEDCVALLRELLGGTEPPAEILPLLERTQGNPFFIEELFHALVAEQVLCRTEKGEWRLERTLDEVQLPGSIEGLLLARLDRLDEPRQALLQVASVIGRRFQRPIIEGVYASQSPLDEGLMYLVGFELIQAEQLDQILSYLFRHALLRDVAYEAILYARRRVLHGQVAHRIESLAGSQLEPHLPVLAWHYLQAEAWDQALAYHIRAAEQATQRFANRDALALYGIALTVAQRLQEVQSTPSLKQQLILIHEQSGDLRLLLGEYDDAEVHFREALKLTAPGEENWLRMYRLLASVEERRSHYEQAFTWLRTGMEGMSLERGEELARCYLLGAGLFFRQSKYAESIEWASKGKELAEQAGNLSDQAHTFKLLGLIYRDQSILDQAIAALDQARALFAQLNVLDGLSDTLNNLGMVYLNMGQWADTIACYEQSLAISENIGDVQAIARTSNNLAVVLVGRNQLERAGELYKLSNAMFARIGSTLGVAVTTYNRGEVLLLQGRPADALPLFLEALETLQQINARNFLPEVLRLTAEAALALGDLAVAQLHAERAFTLAAELAMRVEEATAHRVSAQVALVTGDFAKAQACLETSYAGLSKLDNRYELGKTRYQQARLALAMGDREAAAQARAEAQAIFAELDAQRDLALVQSL
ncbi:tetratricopeptide repeat protein [Candidatus Chloroploca sp. M-50]|uniref:Tetratricopeptide repeat protein n=1 Tax=Candidatus Chloroploca mongolica TaxID=2528176 RepID=A0ABS4DE64_9CHLR|nr:adenylate/guanylate cyclase domain-containing protein [Candidatus Chloroploca mongolica]MBP1467725.1 tetratricopeptide repeat protein [Candidatus Chloroploca mongolica]